MSSALRRLTLVLILGGLAVPLRARQDDAERLIALARQALGGEAKLAAVTSFSARGSVELLQPAHSGGTFELAAQFPDKFVRTGQSAVMPAPMAAAPNSEVFFASPGTFTVGFNAKDVIVSSLASGESLSEPDTRQRYLAKAQGQALEVLIGLFAGSMPGLPVRYKAAIGPDADNSVVVSADGLLPTTLSLDPATHLPARFGNTEYQNFRVIDGLKVPFRLLSGHLVAQDITAFHYNVPIDPKRFRPTGR